MDMRTSNTIGSPASDGIPADPRPFEAVDSRAMRWTLIVLPWIVILYACAKLWGLLLTPESTPSSSQNFNVGMVVIDASAFLAAALSLLAFQGLLLHLPGSFVTIEDRGIVREKPGLISVTAHPATCPEVPDSPRADLRPFLGDTAHWLNSRWQWAAAVLFGVLAIVWRFDRVDWSPSEFVATLGATDAVFETWGFQIPLIVRMMGEILLGCMIGLVAWRVGVVGRQVRRLGTNFDLTPIPWYPDGCGGLEPIGDLCLWSALVVAPAGLHLGGWIALSWFLPAGPVAERAAFWVLPYTRFLVVPIVLALLSFVWPLWSVHRSMTSKPAEVLGLLSGLDSAIQEGERQLLEDAPTIDPDDAANATTKLDSMRAIHQRHGDYPTWPVNKGIVSRFALSQAVPIATLLNIGPNAQALVTSVVEFLKNS